ncbi:hypothetical protein AGMMS49949_08160 [Alphaproteobacteria bacterium]|nr:hypothetical protein AGMMS49949_08160 [Alphaproteobacteria bacterium]GHS99256.1 hypothetical protein AGMMS50296_7340 [Alphaproteobacteria bacterium]
MEQRKALLLAHGVALYDVVKSCDMESAKDRSLKNITPTDLSLLFKEATLEKIYANGAKAYELYQRYHSSKTQKEMTKLPSTSPANAAYSFLRLVQHWECIFFE